jgi:hypothetical protein
LRKERFAMGHMGAAFFERLAGFEGYMIDAQAVAACTSGCERYVQIEATEPGEDWTLRFEANGNDKVWMLKKVKAAAE